MSLPIKNQAFSFVVGLTDSANRPAFKANPTLASGDAKHTGDGSALTNLTTLPATDPAGSRAVKVSLSQAEMNYDRVTIQLVDAAGGEWDELIIEIDTIDPTVAAMGVNVVNYGGTAGTFASGKPSVKLASTDVTGNLSADVQTIKTQTVTCAAGVTVAAFVGNATAAISVDASGRVTVGTNNDKTGYALSAAGVDLVMIDATYNLPKYIKAIGAATAGADSGGPGSPAFKTLDGVTTAVSGTADSSGNRSSISYNL